MLNIQRLQMEVKGIELEQHELIIYLEENNLNPHDEYNPKSNINKRNLLTSALNVLETLANNPSVMKDIKVDDMTITQYHENLLKRIDALYAKIKTIPYEDFENGENKPNFILFYN